MTPSTVYNVREGAKFAADTGLVVVSCSSCGITYAIPESLNASALKYHGDRPNGWQITCPLGHTWWYVGDTAIEREQRERKFAEQRAGRMAAERDQALADARAQKAAKTRIRNSRDRERRMVAAGVCPCCRRSFANLRQHMRSQHPDYAVEGGGNVSA